MEEKNVQNQQELIEEQLEQSAGGRPTALGAQAQAADTWISVRCESCGALNYYYSADLSAKVFTCRCGNVIYA